MLIIIIIIIISVATSIIFCQAQTKFQIQLGSWKLRPNSSINLLFSFSQEKPMGAQISCWGAQISLWDILISQWGT